MFDEDRNAILRNHFQKQALANGKEQKKKDVLSSPKIQHAVSTPSNPSSQSVNISQVSFQRRLSRAEESLEEKFSKKGSGDLWASSSVSNRRADPSKKYRPIKQLDSHQEKYHHTGKGAATRE